jgi:hypothetical protein
MLPKQTERFKQKYSNIFNSWLEFVGPGVPTIAAGTYSVNFISFLEEFNRQYTKMHFSKVGLYAIGQDAVNLSYMADTNGGLMCRLETPPPPGGPQQTLFLENYMHNDLVGLPFQEQKVLNLYTHWGHTTIIDIDLDWRVTPGLNFWNVTRFEWHVNIVAPNNVICWGGIFFSGSFEL